MSTTAPRLSDLDIGTEEPVVHIVEVIGGCRLDTALCGAKVKERVAGGAATCKACMRERMKDEGGRWA